MRKYKFTFSLELQ